MLAARSLLLQADFADRAAAHEVAGAALAAHGIPLTAVDGGFEWNGLHQRGDLGGALTSASAPGSGGRPLARPYLIEEQPVQGYHVIGEGDYFTRLGGFRQRPVLLQAPDGAGPAPS